ncbi:hypothetical protein O181_060033 [Austropuccinia psidii MF-1]|uniref:Reverse transcriptase domain-containing protein n=1 Tax=Austropuccinia psidii MF-1 TaxID=1389203 RepID=A0A9Q3EJY7_9BASI|nr:hypothetical protein [Austropuccinia psidii MF-1]
MTSSGKIIKEIIIPHRKGNIRLNPELVGVDDSHIQGLLQGTDYQKMDGIDISNSKNRHITILTNKEKIFSLDTYQVSAQDPLEELINKLREGQFSTTLTRKQKLSLLKILIKNSPEFYIGEEPLAKIRGHDIELYPDVERPYPPMLRRPPYPESLETRKEIEKHINEILDMDFIRKVGHNEIVEITTPVLITWHDGNSRLCGDFRALNNYTKADRYPIPRIPHASDKLPKAKYTTKMDCKRGFHQKGFEPNSMKLIRIICHMGIYEYTSIAFGITNAPAHFRRMMETILQGSMVVYIDDIIIYSETLEDHVQYIDRVLRKFTPINLKISLKKFNFGQQELLALGNKASGLSLAVDKNKVAAVLQTPVPRNIKEMQSLLGFDSYSRNHIKIFAHIASSLFKLCSKDLYIDEAYSQGLGAALHQRQILDGEPREGVICYISRQLEDSEARYGATKTECLCLVWALEKIHYYLEGAVFELYTEYTALKSLLNMKTTSRHILRWEIAIQEYRGNMTSIFKEGKTHTNADGLSRCPLDNFKINPAYDPEVAAKTPIHLMKINRKGTSDFLKGHQKGVPQKVAKLIQKEQKLPFWE